MISSDNKFQHYDSMRQMRDQEEEKYYDNGERAIPGYPRDNRLIRQSSTDE